MVEHAPEERGVDGSSPSLGTFLTSVIHYNNIPKSKLQFVLIWMELDLNHLKTLSFTVLKGIALYAAANALTAGFTLECRHTIRKRAGGVSELSGNPYLPIEASHINHSRKNHFYGKPYNGIALTPFEHLIYHEQFIENPFAIGLNDAQNDMAIRRLQHTCRELNKQRGIPKMTYEQRQVIADQLIVLVTNICSDNGMVCPYDQL